MAQETTSHGWWQTLPGVITATGGMLTAITALVIALHQAGILGKSDTVENKATLTQKQPAVNEPGVADGALEAAGTKKSAGSDTLAKVKPASKASEPPPANIGSDAQAVFGALKEANIGSSVGERQLLEWLADDDRTYRRIADVSLELLRGKRMNGAPPDIDVIKFHYLELLHRDGAGLLPLGERVERPLLKQAILMASNEKNGGKILRFDRALSDR